jgi:ketosteroid isomerase-like protein
MKQFRLLKFATICVALFLNTACNDTAAGDKTSDEKPDKAMTTKADPAKLKAEIQAQETAWANADNARDMKTVAGFYADDAVSLGNNQPMMVGHAAIAKDVEAYVGKRKKGETVAYDVMDVFGDDNYVTEVGKTTRKDATGKIVYTGKYMAIWENRAGKWICIRDISNDDVKEK